MSSNRKADMYDPLSDDFKRREFPFYWIAQLNALYSQEMERLLKRVDMDVPRWRIIMILKEHSELSISEDRQPCGGQAANHHQNCISHAG